MLALIWFSSTVIAREPMISPWLTNPSPLSYNLISLGLILQSVSLFFPLHLSSLHYFHALVLSFTVSIENWVITSWRHCSKVTSLLPLFLYAPRPLSSSPFWEAPLPTRPALHSTDGGSTFKRCTSIADCHSQRHAERLSLVSAATRPQLWAQSLPRRALIGEKLQCSSNRVCVMTRRKQLWL